MKLNQTLILAGLMGEFIAVTPGQADDSTDEIKALKKRIESLDQKARPLERKHEQETSVQTAKTALVITASASGFDFQPADRELRGSLRRNRNDPRSGRNPNVTSVTSDRNNVSLASNHVHPE
jgi:hypothetical protein